MPGKCLSRPSCRSDLPYCIERADVRGLVPPRGAGAWATYTTMPRWSAASEGNISLVEITLQQLAQKATTMAAELKLRPSDVRARRKSGLGGSIDVETAIRCRFIF